VGEDVMESARAEPLNLELSSLTAIIASLILELKYYYGIEEMGI
jgi:hypothetical protein